MIYVGILVIVVAIYFLVKQYETRMVLIAAGLTMAILSGNPLAAFDAFATAMVTSGLIQAICSVMGFAFVMKYTGCDRHLIQLLASVLVKVRPLLIPGATVLTFIVNIALPSAAGVSAAVGTILIPLLMAAGVFPATAAAAVYAGTFGSMLSPGLMHNPFVAKIAGVNVMEVIRVHMVADIVCMVIGAVCVTVMAFALKENKGYEPPASTGGAALEKANPLYALMPVVPVIILVIAAIVKVPALAKVGVPHAMVFGALLTMVVTRRNPAEMTKSFFDGMGNSYGNIMGIIISAGVFVGGMEAIGMVKAFINMLVSSTAVVKVAATFGPFLLAIVAGSGDAAAIAFNQTVTPHAAQFGLTPINMGSIATLSGALGRTMSPIAGAAIICATIAGVNPMEIAKRNALGMVIAVVVVMFILL